MLHRVCWPDPGLAFDLNHRNMIAPPDFCRLIESLQALGVDIVSLDDAIARLSAPHPRRFVCLTFDDGYVDNHDVVLPIVERYRVPITVYISPGLIDGSALLWWYALDRVIATAPEIRLPLPRDVVLPTACQAEKAAAFATCTDFLLHADAAARDAVARALAERHGVDFRGLATAHMMDWTKVRAMAASRYVEIGAHTLSHPALSRLDAADAMREMSDSRDRLTIESGKPVRHFAYPFGTALAIGPREVKLAAASGFSTAVTAHPGTLFPAHLGHRHALPRHGIGPGDDRAALRLKLAGLARGLQPPWRPAVTHPD